MTSNERFFFSVAPPLPRCDQLKLGYDSALGLWADFVRPFVLSEAEQEADKLILNELFVFGQRPHIPFASWIPMARASVRSTGIIILLQMVTAITRVLINISGVMITNDLHQHVAMVSANFSKASVKVELEFSIGCSSKQRVPRI